MDLGLAPFERGGVLVVSDDEAVDGLAHLLGRGEAGALERPAAEDGEPALYLVEAR